MVTGNSTSSSEKDSSASDKEFLERETWRETDLPRSSALGFVALTERVRIWGKDSKHCSNTESVNASSEANVPASFDWARVLTSEA